MRSTKKQILIAAAVACFGFASAAQAQDAAGGWRSSCSAKTIRGAYGVKLGGTVTTPAGPARLDAVSLMTFDGAGILTSTTRGRVGGNPIPQQGQQPYNGTYTVNADCTGTLSFATSIGGVASSVAFVIVENGEELFLVVDSAAAQVSGEAERVGRGRGYWHGD